MHAAAAQAQPPTHAEEDAHSSAAAPLIGCSKQAPAHHQPLGGCVKDITRLICMLHSRSVLPWLMSGTNVMDN